MKLFRFINVLLLIVIFLIILGWGEKVNSAANKTNLDDPTEWFRDAKFGMFIHWSIPSVPDDDWERIIGRPRKGRKDLETMWSMRRGRIPVETYEKLADEFNPVDYDAEKFVTVAKAAGMKYIVLTSKHHDGFAMFDSKASEFDIPDATPYKKDIIEPLEKACKKHGIKLCFYYSHAQDWHHPHGAGNDWDYDPKEKNFEIYFEEKCKPQVRELLTNYGPVGLMWFDTPAVISKNQSEELLKLVKSIQPDCLVNSRIGHGYCDYLSTGDNQIPEAVIDFPWEVPATINNHWSWQAEQVWRTPKDTIRKLVNIVSRGGNYLLNVGPDPRGRIPKKSADNLKVMGEWLKKNGEAIYGSSVNPFHTNFEWGVVTTRDNFIYLHIMDKPEGDLVLYGLDNNVAECYMLDGGKKLKFSHDHKNKKLEIEVPDKLPDPYVNVVTIRTDGPLNIDTTPVQSKGKIELNASGLPLTFGRDGFTIHPVPIDGAAVNTNSQRPQMQLSSDASYIKNWLDEDEWVSWEFIINEPGLFKIEAVTSKERVRIADMKLHFVHPGEHDLKVIIDEKEISGSIAPVYNKDDRSDVTTVLGQVEIDKPGRHKLTFKADKINKDKRIGLTLKTVKLLLQE